MEVNPSAFASGSPLPPSWPRHILSREISHACERSLPHDTSNIFNPTLEKCFRDICKSSQLLKIEYHWTTLERNRSLYFVFDWKKLGHEYLNLYDFRGKHFAGEGVRCKNSSTRYGDCLRKLNEKAWKGSWKVTPWKRAEMNRFSLPPARSLS